MAIDDGDDRGQLRLPRRLVLKSLAAGVGLWDQACGAPLEQPAHQSHAIATAEPIESRIRRENRLLGTSDYLLRNPARSSEVEGYASVCSAIAGDQVDISVSVNRAQGVRWDLYRVGYYQGHGARLIESGSAVRVAVKVLPKADPQTGLLECAWPATFSLTIDAAWLTGYYLLKLTNDDGFESYVPLVVRETGRTAPLLMQASVTTWQAYNLWGGINLYVNHLTDLRRSMVRAVIRSASIAPMVPTWTSATSSIRWCAGSNSKAMTSRTSPTSTSIARPSC